MTHKPMQLCNSYSLVNQGLEANVLPNRGSLRSYTVSNYCTQCSLSLLDSGWRNLHAKTCEMQDGSGRHLSQLRFICLMKREMIHSLRYYVNATHSLTYNSLLPWDGSSVTAHIDFEHQTTDTLRLTLHTWMLEGIPFSESSCAC